MEMRRNGLGVSVGALPSCPNQVLCLDLTGADLSILGTLLNVLHQFLLLILQFDPLPVQFPLCPVQRPLVFAQALRRGHALPECPLDDLRGDSQKTDIRAVTWRYIHS